MYMAQIKSSFSWMIHASRVQNNNISPITHSCLKYDGRRPGEGHTGLICFLACLHLANPQTEICIHFYSSVEALAEYSVGPSAKYSAEEALVVNSTK